MKNRRNRKQREEVRKILHEMRLQLAAQRAAQEAGRSTPLRLNELFSHVRGNAA
jgi:hypothetical protein